MTRKGSGEDWETRNKKRAVAAELIAVFEVPGQPVGYYTRGKAPNWKRYNKYVAFKQKVQEHAKTAGVALPLVATRGQPLFISTHSVFKNGVHSDPENVHKGVVDALFYDKDRKRKGAGDKYTGGFFDPPRYDKLRPMVLVRIETHPAELLHMPEK